MRHPRSLLVLIFLILCLTASTASSTAAQMQTNGEDWYIAEYAKMVGIPYEEAVRRLVIQAEMTELQLRILEGEASYAGAWYVSTPEEFGLVVAFTAPDGEEIIQKYLEGIEWAHLVKVQQARYSIDELNVLASRIVEAALTTAIPFTAGLNIPDGKVRLDSPTPDTLRERLEAMEEIQAYLSDIQYAYLVNMPEPAESDDSFISEVARLRGISHEEAAKRVALQPAMSELHIRIAEGEASYAGAWYVSTPEEFGLVVAFTAPDGEEIIQKYLEGIEWAHLVKVQQAKYSLDELIDRQSRVVNIALTTGIPFEAGLSIPEGKVRLYVPTPGALREQLETIEEMRPYLAEIEYVYVERLMEPAVLKYPYLLGGHPAGCTTGYAVIRNSTGRRYMTTAGHCDNTLHVEYGSGNPGIYLGDVDFESDPFGGDPSQWHLDMQTHRVETRSFDLTNMIRTDANATHRVGSRRLKAQTLNTEVCKYGKSTGKTCGIVIDVNFWPYLVYGILSSAYVRVHDYGPRATDIACPGDSGSPVFRIEGGLAVAVGLLSGSNGGACNDGIIGKEFYYSPVDEVEAAGHSVLTSPYQQHYYLMVWSGSGPSCTMHKRPVNDDGTLGPATTSPCPISPPESGAVQSYNAYVLGNFWREGIWQNGRGYTRMIPLNNNGTVNWGAAGSWVQCCHGQAAPLAQDGKVVGNTYYLNVFTSGGGCTEYRFGINSGGGIITPPTTGACRTTIPGSGNVQSYNNYLIAETWREGMWKSNGTAFIRAGIPLNSTNTDINYSAAPAWSPCCSPPIPDSQGGDIVTHLP